MCCVKPISPSRIAKVLVHHMNYDIFLVSFDNRILLSLFGTFISVLKREMLKKNVWALFLKKKKGTYNAPKIHTFLTVNFFCRTTVSFLDEVILECVVTSSVKMVQLI